MPSASLVLTADSDGSNTSCTPSIGSVVSGLVRFKYSPKLSNSCSLLAALRIIVSSTGFSEKVTLENSSLVNSSRRFCSAGFSDVNLVVLLRLFWALVI